MFWLITSPSEREREREACLNSHQTGSTRAAFFSCFHQFPPWGWAPISQAFVIADVFIVVIGQSENDWLLLCNLGELPAPDSHMFLKWSSISKISPISRAQGCETKQLLVADGKWGWEEMRVNFHFEWFALMMWCALSQPVIACVLIHSFGSHDFPDGCGSLRAPRLPSSPNLL